MKKIFSLLLISMSAGGLFALSMGNPTEASLYSQGLWCNSGGCSDPCDPCFNWCDAWSVRLGFRGDYVFNRHLKSNDFQPVSSSTVDRAEISTNAAYLVLNICDRVDVFATLGATSIFIREDSASILPDTVGAGIGTLHFATDFSWSVGGRATLWECGCFGIGLEGEYFSTHPELNFLNIASFIFNRKGSTHYKEWQVGLGASYLLCLGCPNICLVPYTGVTWSGCTLDEFIAQSIVTFNGGVSQPARIAALENQKLWSYVIGTSLTFCDSFGLNLEGRFAAEKAVSVTGQFRF